MSNYGQGGSGPGYYPPGTGYHAPPPGTVYPAPAGPFPPPVGAPPGGVYPAPPPVGAPSGGFYQPAGQPTGPPPIMTFPPELQYPSPPGTDYNHPAFQPMLHALYQRAWAAGLGGIPLDANNDPIPLDQYNRPIAPPVRVAVVEGLFAPLAGGGTFPDAHPREGEDVNQTLARLARDYPHMDRQELVNQYDLNAGGKAAFAHKQQYSHPDQRGSNPFTNFTGGQGSGSGR